MNLARSLAALCLLTAPALADQKIDEAVAKAEDQFQRGKPDDALGTLQKLAAQNPRSAEVPLALGRLQDRLGDLEGERKSLAKASQLATEGSGAVKADVLSALALLDLRSGTGKNALLHAKEAVDVAPTASSLASLAEAQARVGDGAAALATAHKAVAAGDTPLTHEAKGVALLGLQRANEAESEFRTALSKDPKSSRLRVGLAQALLAGGKAGEAVAEAKKVTEADTHSGEAFAILGAAILADSPKSWPEAIAQAQQGAFLSPTSPFVQTTVGHLFEAARNFDQATRSYATAIDTDPGYVPAQSAQISLLIRKGDLDPALARARRLVADTPASGDAQALLGEVLLRKKDYEGAREPLVKATQVLPGSATAWYFLGEANQFTGHIQDAVRAYEQAYRIDRSNVDYASNYGLALGVAGSHDEGIAVLKELVEGRGRDGVAGWANLAWVYRNMEPPKIEESLAAYRHARSIDPKNPQVELGIGWADSYTRRWEEAITAFQKAIELDPSVAGEAFNGIAWCHFFKRDMRLAREFADKAEHAGHAGGSLATLRRNILRVESAVKAGRATEADRALKEAQAGTRDETPDLGQARSVLTSKGNAARKQQTARELRRAGAEGVELLDYALNDEDIGVKEAAVASLRALCAVAKAAIPHLQQLIKERPDVMSSATREQMAWETRWADVQRQAKGALACIQEKSP
jgi:tetratricopeptide (TPR) repeat protein